MASPVTCSSAELSCIRLIINFAGPYSCKSSFKLSLHVSAFGICMLKGQSFYCLVIYIVCVHVYNTCTCALYTVTVANVCEYWILHFGASLLNYQTWCLQKIVPLSYICTCVHIHVHLCIGRPLLLLYMYNNCGVFNNVHVRMYVLVEYIIHVHIRSLIHC